MATDIKKYFRVLPELTLYIKNKQENFPQDLQNSLKQNFSYDCSDSRFSFVKYLSGIHPRYFRLYNDELYIDCNFLKVKKCHKDVFTLISKLNYKKTKELLFSDDYRLPEMDNFIKAILLSPECNSIIEKRLELLYLDRSSLDGFYTKELKDCMSKMLSYYKKLYGTDLFQASSEEDFISKVYGEYKDTLINLILLRPIFENGLFEFSTEDKKKYFTQLKNTKHSKVKTVFGETSILKSFLFNFIHSLYDGKNTLDENTLLIRNEATIEFFKRERYLLYMLAHILAYDSNGNVVEHKEILTSDIKAILVLPYSFNITGKPISFYNKIVELHNFKDSTKPLLKDYRNVSSQQFMVNNLNSDDTNEIVNYLSKSDKLEDLMHFISSKLSVDKPKEPITISNDLDNNSILNLIKIFKDTIKRDGIDSIYRPETIQDSVSDMALNGFDEDSDELKDLSLVLLHILQTNKNKINDMYNKLTNPIQNSNTYLGGSNLISKFENYSSVLPECHADFYQDFYNDQWITKLSDIALLNFNQLRENASGLPLNKNSYALDTVSLDIYDIFQPIGGSIEYPKNKNDVDDFISGLFKYTGSQQINIATTKMTPGIIADLSHETQKSDVVFNYEGKSNVNGEFTNKDIRDFENIKNIIYGCMNRNKDKIITDIRNMGYKFKELGINKNTEFYKATYEKIKEVIFSYYTNRAELFNLYSSLYLLKRILLQTQVVISQEDLKNIYNNTLIYSNDMYERILKDDRTMIYSLIDKYF